MKINISLQIWREGERIQRECFELHLNIVKFYATNRTAKITSFLHFQENIVVFACAKLEATMGLNTL